DDDTEITSETIAPLASWVEQATQVPIPALPITTASGRRLKAVLSMTGVLNARAAAAYLPGQIVISNIMWDPESLRSQSYLVHELVHHTQLIGRKQYSCAAAKEREAYMLQNRWLEANGEEPLVTQEWIERISSCSAFLSEDDAELARDQS
ncbi:MAG: DUF6647 family protein, partial [Bdellovibrionales bacterium]